MFLKHSTHDQTWIESKSGGGSGHYSNSQQSFWQDLWKTRVGFKRVRSDFK